MEDTDTYITWPNKLKLGAKSKKDPHVRIAGRQEDVQAAKDRIMTILYTRCNRVTMKMDISYTDHSHIIGKGGLSIKRVMEETQCHVHFPDSNRSNPMEKSNQVSISGDLEGVECARSRVRVRTPPALTLDAVFSIPGTHPFDFRV
jgi:protein bicaudal C